MGNPVGDGNMNRARGSQEHAATAAATPLQGLCRDVMGKAQDPLTLPQRPQHYSHVPRSEYIPGDVFGMSSGSFSRGSSTVGFQASAFFGLDGLQRRTQGWGKLVDGSRWPGDIWTIDGAVSLEQSSGGSDAGGKGSDEVSYGRVDADIKMTTEEVHKQKHSVGNTSTTSSPTENRTKQTPAVPVQDYKRSRDSPIGGTAAGGAWTQLPPGARAKDGDQPGPDRFDNGPVCAAEAAQSSNVPSSKAQVVQKEQEPQMGLQSPISSHPPSLALAKPYHHHAHFSSHKASQLDIASPSSISTRNSKPSGDRASKFPDPISPSRNSSIPAFQPSATTPSSSSANSWHSLSPNASSLPRHRADSSLHLDHHTKLASTSLFSQKHLPLHPENQDKMSANDHKVLSNNNPDDTFNAQGFAGMLPANRLEAIHANATTNVMPTGARINSFSSQGTSQMPANRLGETIGQANQTTFAEERLRELWAAGKEMMSGSARLHNTDSMRHQQGEHATSAGTNDDDIYNASDDEAKGAFSHQAERRFTGEIARTHLAGEIVRNNQGDYYLDRGNGRCTKLIPADMLPPLVDVPAIQLSAPGMTILPVPAVAGHGGRSVYHQPVQMATPFAAQTTDPGSSSLVPLRGSPDNVQV
ncbi:hypothetical protein MAPG_07544 [Magnaporthiopsis poae ATCC 64411]|uniref:Uncharacterized protein n=1 Tax=Magnaporthiopsis poae (strain ATCC 64411 / 73-15) TaxID=644358 RepID=A0A0C4E4Y8_MAGP6|nr:hypothetical protein MAPG_07544 [Magnaporthiopsis poae ATCC 64411]